MASEDLLVPPSKLTKKWLEEVMEGEFHESPKVIEVAPLGAEAHGYMSLMRRVHLEWKEKKGKPETVIIKLPTSSAAQDAWAESSENGKNVDGNFVVSMMHRTESSAYSALRKYPEIGLSIPHVYATLSTDTPTPVIVMEDLHGCTLSDLVEGFNETQLYAITDEIVKLHAMSYKHKEILNYGVSLEDAIISETSFPILVDGVSAQLAATYPQLTENIGKLRENYTKKRWFYELGEYVSTYPLAVFCHGDMWSPQLMWRGDNLIGIVDWALAHKGTLTEDIHHVLFCCTKVELRKKLTTKLLDHYYGGLEKKLDELGVEIPFTRQQLDDDYKYTLAYSAAQACFAAGMWTNSEVIRRGKPDDGERIAEIIERTKACVDECVEANGW